MKSAAPDTLPSFRPEAKVVGQTTVNGPAYAARWVQARTAAVAYSWTLTVVVAVAEVVTVAVAAGAGADAAAVTGTSYDAL